MDVHLRDLRYFVAVAEELSFTRAATERLFISQPTLSKQIRQLELTLRVTLFERDRRTVALTPEGQALLPRARELIEGWSRTQRALADAGRGRTLTVGFQTRIGRGLIPVVTGRMARVLPDWKLLFRQVSWADPSAGLCSDEVDVAVAWLPFPPGDKLSWTVVATEERWVALPAGHRLAARDVVPFAELADEPFIALPASAGPLRAFWLAADQRDTPPRIAAEASTADEMFEAVAAALGVALVSVGDTDNYRRADLAFRPVTGLPPAELAVAWRSAGGRREVHVFADACLRCLCDPQPVSG
ncbi:LysR family transcriptional regulator [Pseudonocardia acaciae]|uniref:LysR substrate-binding domain-containing protein n=1 Tax=Pseudonocardia acaciae TaxID=551276 RepID=UPI00068650D9|nr:LysR family transcriptional regulator [Pseudonocardia acaciae]